MGFAYTAGLTVTPHTVMRKSRRLPLAGELLVKVGQQVGPQDVVARAELPGPVIRIDAAGELGIDPEKLPGSLCLPLNTYVDEGEVLARARVGWGRRQRELRAPARGTLESASAHTGQILLRGAPRLVERIAFVPGTVVAVEPGVAVTIETHGGLVQGVFGVGGETLGRLTVVRPARAVGLTANDLGPEYRGQIVVVAGWITADAVRQARAVSVRGIVAGGIHDFDLKQVLGYDLGVAVTGDEALGLTLVITEGFGPLAMASRTFELIAGHAGRLASLSGATRIRAGVVRPELILPAAAAAERGDPESIPERLAAGVRVRAVGGPMFGRVGRCAGLPSAPARLPTGAVVRVLEVAFDDGGRALMPRANVELIKP
jgi:hypothetical protein